MIVTWLITIIITWLSSRVSTKVTYFKSSIKPTLSNKPPFSEEES